jgi:hypothetical protein
MLANNDERFTAEGPPAVTRIPLDEISFSTNACSCGVENDDDAESVVSDVSDDVFFCLQAQQTKIVDNVPRSIFSSYWKDDSKEQRHTSIPAQPAAPAVGFKRAAPLAQVPQQRDLDPYQYFGIERPEEKRVDEKAQTETEASSLNTYEKMLQRYEQTSQSRTSRSPSSFENRPFWMSFFGRNGHFSEPQLSSKFPYQRNMQSDTALVKKPKKSCLRSGRFSCTHSSSCKQFQSEPEHCSKVSFQPKIEVLVFELPVEHFASSGWSKMFG